MSDDLYLTEDEFREVARHYGVNDVILEANDHGDGNWWLSGAEYNLNMNFGVWMEQDGYFDIELNETPQFGARCIRNLEGYFLHPLFPTEEELELFLLETGREYPLRATTKKEVLGD